MKVKSQAIIDLTSGSRLPEEIPITLIVQRKTIKNVKKMQGEVLNQRNNSYIPSKPVLDVPDHVKHVSQTENLAKFTVLGVVASSGKKCPNEWVSADMMPISKHDLP